ncbi:MAG TPA: prenyltransferase/squalene oxidase repeat-containing protein, partial [Phycisphaerae bacterium]|nr:prenyltransferase/squalene oxidase repeat-containing protein [Phycisphaerae bacterium]
MMTVTQVNGHVELARQTLDTQTSCDRHSENLAHILKSGQLRLLSRRINGCSWNYNAHLGRHFISQYLILSHWLGRRVQNLDGDRLRRELLETQLSDGSWQQIPDANMHSGELNATVFNYWALKALGSDPHDSILSAARAFILNCGGLKATALFTKIILALFSNVCWSEVPYTPYLLFLEQVPLNYRGFAQWVIPHLMPIAYLRRNHVHKKFASSFALTELLREPQENVEDRICTPNRLFDGHLIHKILTLQQPAGSWGGYTLSTLFSMMAIDHYAKHCPEVQNRISKSLEKGFRFVEDLYFGRNVYDGALMDGSDWDTLLVGNCLLTSGLSREMLHPTVDYILGRQQSSGGFPYGRDFEYAPDVDDTAAAILMLSHWGAEYSTSIQDAIRWLCSMQNRDGGWSAFDRNDNSNWLLRRLTRNYIDSVDLFDESSADVTGHVLEAMGTVGLNADNSDSVRRGIEYLWRAQDAQTGAWPGRWAVNYLFGTTAALVGMLAVGESLKNPDIQRILKWIIDQQNDDGGFGESTASYLSPTAHVSGISAPTQTAWVLIALCRADLGTSNAAQRAADYLIATH